MGDDENDDDVYPQSSIYSDAGAARDLLAGLSYDESKDGDSEDFDRYFEEHSMPAESEFSPKRNDAQDEPDNPEFDDDLAAPEPPPPSKPAAPVKVIPKRPQPQPEQPEAFLPEMRPDSVFAGKPEPEPAPPVRNDPPLPPLTSGSETRLDDDFDDYDEDGELAREGDVFADLPAGTLPDCGMAGCFDVFVICALADSVSLKYAAALCRMIRKASSQTARPCGIRLLLTDFTPSRMKLGGIPDIDGCIDTVGARLIGVLPHDESALSAALSGQPPDEKCELMRYARDTAERIYGARVPLDSPRSFRLRI